MTDQNSAAQPHAIPPHAQIMQLSMGVFISQAIYVAARLGIADLIADGAKTTAEMADKTGTNEGALYRVLRSLASVGVFTETSDRAFVNSPMSDTLRDDSATSTRAMALFMGDEAHWSVYPGMMHSVETGEPAWEHIHGVPCFPYLFEVNRPFGSIFDQAMTSVSHSEIGAVLQAYDFSGIGTLADIAGGRGHLLASILQKYPEMNGVLFDMGVVIDAAQEFLSSQGVADRVQIVAGDFFSEIPVVADAYILKHIIHDWYDDKSEVILGNIRRSMPDGSRVLIVDAVIPPGNDPHPAKILDLEMLIAPGGIERTNAEFETLLGNAGFRINRIIPTRSPVSVIEAVKA
jgi:hypothetical protein